MSKTFTNVINLLNLNDEELIQVSKKYLFSLNLNEMKRVQEYFRVLGREPRDIELETIAQTWSEHCKHKTLTGIIKYREKNLNTGEEKVEIIDNLLKSTIFKATKEMKHSWCLSAFKDNAGIIEFDENMGVAFKVETHNHPTALEPYGGAGTGIGGVIRDILGVGKGAEPIFNTDVFCFGNQDIKSDALNEKILHPRQIMKGAVEGVRDYGNRMGIPTINGTTLFDEGFIFNPLVFCGTAGIIPKNMIEKKVMPGDYIVSIGGRVGRDGIHGATFSSLALDENVEQSAVQIGNPIVEKKILDGLLFARDKNLYNSLTDCGAGGLSSAVGELGENTGVELFLDKVPLKYSGLFPWEIWVSEAQERMVLAVPEKNLNSLIEIFQAEDVEVSILGKFTNTKKLILFFNDEKICELDMDFLHNGLPKYEREAFAIIKSEKNFLNDYKIENDKLEDYFYKIISHPNVSSKEWIVKQYDYEVKGNTIIKPFQGNSVISDTSVVKPLSNSKKGIATSNGINFEYGKYDTRKMILANINEAIRNILCAGGVIENIAFLDNFCWGDPNDKEKLGSLVLACKACYDYSVVLDIPFISGKDSLNNTYLNKDGKKISIPDTMLISCFAVLKDVSKCLTMNFKKDDNSIYIIGNTNNELKGTIFNLIEKNISSTVPDTDIYESKKIFNTINEIIDKRLIESIHDISDGGIAICIAEMVIASNFGAIVDLSDIPTNENKLESVSKLFSESQSRFILEVKNDNLIKIEDVLLNSKIPFKKIGKVIKTDELVIKNGSEILINCNKKDINEKFLLNSWNNL